MSNDARLEILARIRRTEVEELPPVEREPIRPSVRSQRDVIEQFAHRVAEYRAHVTRIPESGVQETIRALLADRGHERVIAPTDLPSGLLPPELPVLQDEKLDVFDFNNVQAVVTTCAIAIAETGTVILDHGPGQGRRALTLVPDHHICIVRDSQVVESLTEAVALLEPNVLLGRPLTWVSGPSATSDIELSRVEGVHGPRRLDIVLIQTDLEDSETKKADSSK